MTATRPHAPWLLPNLGAEEGRDWAAYPTQPHARVAARLFALLLPADTILLHPLAAGGWAREPAALHWPPALGEPARDAVAPWLDPGRDALAWLPTPGLARALAEEGPDGEPARLAGASPALIHRLHDKCFALEAARSLALDSPALAGLSLCLEPEDLADSDRTVAHLAQALDRWPAWTGRRFTLKPRLGSSGRGRVGGQGRIDTPALRGALPRLARCGGAVFEPWLERTLDLSVALHVPRTPDPPEVLASFELIATRSGVYRGHLGVLEADGGIGSGDAQDARLRAGATAVAARARDAGFAGACGVDAFRFRGPDGQEAWRGAVELNARPTMGVVVWGLLRRARARLREHGPKSAAGATYFLFALFDAEAEARSRPMLDPAPVGLQTLELASPRARDDEPRPRLHLADDPGLLRALARAVASAR